VQPNRHGGYNNVENENQDGKHNAELVMVEHSSKLDEGLLICDAIGTLRI
jgi:hypothetical protein